MEWNVGLDYLGFTSLHGTPLRPPWKRQHCLLLITEYCSCASVCSTFQTATRSVCLLSLVTALWWLRLKYFHWGKILLSLLYFSWKHAGTEGVRGSGRGPVSCLTLSHPVSSLFSDRLLDQGPDQHSIPYSNPLDNFLFSWLHFWTSWEWVSFWDLLITKGAGFDDRSTCRRSSWMLKRHLHCTETNRSADRTQSSHTVWMGCIEHVFQVAFQPSTTLLPATLPLREGKLF